MHWNSRVMQDLVYARVRCHVDLLSLVDLEIELGESIERALQESGELEEGADLMSRRLLDEAWRRLEAEWRETRDMDCPLCSGPYECPAPVA